MTNTGYVEIAYSEIEKYWKDVKEKNACQVKPRGKFRFYSDIRYAGLVCHPHDMKGHATGVAAKTCSNCSHRTKTELSTVAEIISHYFIDSYGHLPSWFVTVGVNIPQQYYICYRQDLSRDLLPKFLPTDIEGYKVEWIEVC